MTVFDFFSLMLNDAKAESDQMDIIIYLFSLII